MDCAPAITSEGRQALGQPVVQSRQRLGSDAVADGVAPARAVGAAVLPAADAHARRPGCGPACRETRGGWQC